VPEKRMKKPTDDELSKAMNEMGNLLDVYNSEARLLIA